jgi:hypothetical protein
MKNQQRPAFRMMLSTAIVGLSSSFLVPNECCSVNRIQSSNSFHMPTHLYESTTPDSSISETINDLYEDEDEDAEDREVILPEIKAQFVVNGISPPKETPLNEAVARVANISLDRANELIQLGAVWARLDTLTEEDILAQYDGASDSEELYADFPKGWNNAEFDEEEMDLDEYIEKMANQRFRRILTPTLVSPGTDLRIYPNPRRFPACYDIDKSNLLYEDTTFVVVDKPPMLPTQPDASNYYENCPGCTQELLGPFFDILGNEIRRPLLCHRVDSVVGGCVVMSKDRNGQKVFQELQRQRKLRKVYLAVTKKQVPVGMHIAWMFSPQTARGAFEAAIIG